MAADREGKATRVDTPLPRAPQVFSPGDVLSGRYVITRFIAEGGMGEVYEARDHELAETIAIKTIRGEQAKRPLLLARFKREIHVARQVTHPNVCRVLELGQHQGTVFLTMQMLVGDTLAVIIHRRKKLTVAEALPIARQVAAAVDAAHKAGVIHRDLKPGNVMLLAPEKEGGPPRAVVTDFGLARGTDDDPQHDVTLSGEVAGSPAYMAPEQVEGKGVGPLADVYAFGLILFEMVTGVRPFDGENAFTLASKRLAQPAPTPRMFTPSLDARWERMILSCLARDPARRPASAGEAMALLDVAAPPKRRLWLAAAAGGALAVGAAVGAVYALGSHGHATKTAAGRSVAVIGFKNLAARGDTAWISSALSEMIGSELATAMHAVPGQEVSRARTELALGDADAFNAATLAKIRGDLGVDYVVVGAYLAFGEQNDRVRLDLRVQDAANGESVVAITEQGTTADLPELVERATAKIGDALGVSPSGKPGELRAALPTNAAAARLYSEGVAQLHRLELVAARDSLQAAAKLDPAHPMIRAALADVWSELGYDGSAREQAKLALEHATQLPARARLLVEARYHLAAKEWDGAIAAYRQLAAALPGDVDAGLQLAHAEVLAGRGKDALATLAQLRVNDPRVDLEQARAYVVLSDLGGRRDAAARAAERAAIAGASLLAARANLELAAALAGLGDHDKALELLDASERTFEQAHDTNGLAEAMHDRALVLYEQGKFGEGDELETKAASYLRGVGSVRVLTRALVNLGVMAQRRGDGELAITRFREAVDTARGADDRWTLSLALSGVADTERLLGRLDEARRAELEALDLARALDARRAEGYAAQTLAQIALAQGKLADAEQQAKAGSELADRVGEPRLAALAEVELGRTRFQANDLLGARDHFERAVAGHAKANEPADAAIAEIELAEVALADGRAAEAVERGKHAADALAAAPDDLAHALAVLARAQLAAGALTDARASAAAAEAAGKTAYPGGRIHAVLANAAVAAAGGNAAHARELYAAAKADADQRGFVLLAMYAELAAAQLDHATARLTALADSARARGLVRLAALAAKPAR